MITALSPLDGRYSKTVDPLRKYFSEYALIFYRVVVEVRWLQYISSREEIGELKTFNPEEIQILDEIILNFSEEDAQRVKDIEAVTRHDVKAVEYFLKEKLKNTAIEKDSEWIHFACTSEDINNLAYSMMLRDAVKEVMIPAYDLVMETLEDKAKEWKAIPMLAMTHGQAASPTTVGKSFFVFAARLSAQLSQLESQDFLGKINGATGNFNAHVAAYPDADWLDISQNFVESLGLQWNPFTEQIDPHDFIAEIAHTTSRINTIIIDFSRDTWGYISRGVFGQKTVEGEIGSSTMPHKVNPIDFENAEGNFGIANAMFGFFAEKLPISRWQRDLTDSTVLRNLGVGFGHSLLGVKSVIRGISKLKVMEENCLKELNNNVEVLGEAVQTVMRKYEIENPYEKLKELTRGKKISIDDYKEFVRTLEIPQEEIDRLLELTPATYTGIAEQIVEKFGH